MKRKPHLVLLASFAVASFCEMTLPAATADDAKTFVGTIQSVRVAPLQFRSGPPFWPFMKMEVAADNGVKMNFFVCGPGKNPTSFFDSNGNAMAVKGAKDVGIGKKVEIKYLSPPEMARWADKQLAVSVHYVAADYVPPAAATPTKPTAAP